MHGNRLSNPDECEQGGRANKKARHESGEQLEYTQTKLAERKFDAFLSVSLGVFVYAHERVRVCMYV